MQNTDQHSVDTPIDSTANQDSESVDHVTQHSCVQKRNVFKEEFHNLIPLVPKDTNDQSEQSGGARQRDEEDETLFITHRNPYPDTAAHTHSPATHTQNHPAHRHTPADTHTPSRRTKHESLDDLQSSTYFGPTVTDWTHVSQTPPTKSHSLDIDNRLERSGLERSELGKSAFGGVERSGLHGSGLEGPGLQGSGLEGPGLQGSGLESSGLESSGLLGGLERFGLEGSGLEGPGFNLLGIGVDMRDVLKHLSGRSLTGLSDWMLNIEDVVSVGTQTDLPDRKHLRSLMLGDKLSLDNPDIAEDDISAIFRFLDDISMCGSMAVLPNSGGEVGGGSGGQAGATSPDRQGRLGKLRRLFHSLEAPEEGLRSGLCRLLLRVAELEQRLEPLAELREQLAQVLATLHRLEQRGQQTSVPQQAAPGANAGLEWSDRGRGASGKRNGLFTRRASKAHTESSSSEQHREWSISYSKEQHTHTAQTEEEVIRPHLLPETHQAPPRSCTMSTDQRLTSWSQSELTPLDLQAPESLEFWMEEIYTPGSDTLLRRTHTHTPCTRAKAYRITALGVTAVAILILIIVIPICTA